jgi:hypothetical protein
VLRIIFADDEDDVAVWVDDRLCRSGIHGRERRPNGELIEVFEVEVKLCCCCYLTSSATNTDLAACYGLDLGQKISDRVTLNFQICRDYWIQVRFLVRYKLLSV